MDQYNTYTPTSGGDVYSDLASRVNNFQPQYQELANQESQAYAAPASLLANYQKQYAGGYGPDAMSQLSGVLSQIGNMYGTADVMRGTIGNAQGRLEQMSQNALDQYNAAKESTLNKYNMLAPVWNQYRSEEQAAQERAWQEQQNAMDRITQENLARAASVQPDYSALYDYVNNLYSTGGESSTVDPIEQAYNESRIGENVSYLNPADNPANQRSSQSSQNVSLGDLFWSVPQTVGNWLGF